VSDMRNIQQNENNKLPVVRYLLYLLVVVTIIAGAAFAKYISSLSGTDKARAATFDYEINVSRNTLDKITNPDDDKIAFVDSNSVPTALNTTTDNPSKQVEFLVSLYATSMLADAENCEFDEVVRVIDVTYSNNSEVTVNAIISDTLSNIDEIGNVAGGTGNGIVWCLFNEDDNYADYDDILTKLGYASISSVPSGYDLLIDNLNAANAKTLAAWNADAVLAPNTGEKTLTIVLWAEHEAITAYGWDFEELVNNSSSGPLEQSIDINYAVTQVD